jgi:hypothetical protein
MRTHRSQNWVPIFLLSISAIVLSSSTLKAQTAGTPQSIETKLSAQYTLSKATADHTDLVTGGAVLILKKDGLLMISTSSAVPSGNTYKDGKIAHGAWKMAKVPGLGGMFSRSGDSSDVKTRTFVTGEKFWVTKITVHDDGIVLDLMSDPISDVRYYSTLKFPYTKGVYPSDDVALKSVQEVLDVAPPDKDDQQTAAAGQGGGGGAPGGGAPPAPAAPAAPAEPAPAPMAAIPPPPPPSDTPPPTIALKQTKAQVVAMFGQPTKVVKLATKEIDYYPDMKVTFVNDKVTDIQ